MDYNTSLISRNVSAAEIALHEIGNMIMGLSFSMQKLSDRNPDLINNEDYLDIKDEIKDMIQLIINSKETVKLNNELKNISNDIRQVIVDKKSINLDKEITKILDKYDSVCEQNDIEVKYTTYRCNSNLEKDILKENNLFNDSKIKIEDEYFKVKGDNKEIRRVIDNLIKNAIEELCSDENKNLQSKYLDITMIKEENEIVIEFNNNGRVISCDKIKDIFLKASSSKKSGMGIGLIICKEIIDKYKGKIKAVSDEISGTTFTICLPIN